MFYDEIEKKSPATSWQKHPTTGWYDWTSAKFGYVKNWKTTSKEKIEDWYFKVYDKTHVNTDGTKGMEKHFTLKEMPKEFIVISESWNVKGFLKSKGWIWGPEIYDFNEPLTVLHDKEVLYKGLWSDIKPDVEWVWLKIWRNLHCFDPKNPDEIYTICLKGKASWQWGETFEWWNEFAFLNKKISFGEEKELHNGDTDYTVPTFVIGDNMSEAEREKRNEHMNTLRKYHESYTQSSPDGSAGEVITPTKEVPPVDELPF